MYDKELAKEIVSQVLLSSKKILKRIEFIQKIDDLIDSHWRKPKKFR